MYCVSEEFQDQDKLFNVTQTLHLSSKWLQNLVVVESSALFFPFSFLLCFFAIYP